MTRCDLSIYTSRPAQLDHPYRWFVSFMEEHGGHKSEHAILAQRLAAHTSFPVVIPNYRLTKPETPIKHPTHTEDLLQFLNFILEWEGPQNHPHPYDSSKLYIIGHSCSAHMLTSIYFTPALPHAALPSLVPSKKLLESTQAIALSEGIYDIDLLINSFPQYKSWFIANAFDDLTSYAPFNTTAYNLHEGSEHIHWLILHSRDDTLVDAKQSVKFKDHIESILGKEKVLWDMSLKGEHDQMLREAEYPRVVGQFILDHRNKYHAAL
ncbi:unnamed protein product [Somion occarium]|uniref:Uncharacterized protein n=1 Tax=Somion occarium TaxID=3059160 RepID=A0ABP1DAL4_9APHY